MIGQQTPSIILEMNNMNQNMSPEKKKFFFQFGGQGGGYFAELKRLYQREEQLKEYFNYCSESIDEIEDLINSAGYLTHGLNFEKWLQGEGLPPDSYLENYLISIPGIFITQVAYFDLLKKSGFPMEQAIRETVGCTGHSQGIYAAALVSIASKGFDFYKVFKDVLKLIILSGIHLSRVYEEGEDQGSNLLSQELDQQNPTPMVAVAGIDLDSLMYDLNEYNRNNRGEPLFIGLKNSDNSFVLVGKSKDLVRFRAGIKDKWQIKNVKWNYLDISIPFHCEEHLGAALEPFVRDLGSIGFGYKISDLSIPVYSTNNGADIRTMAEIKEPKAIKSLGQVLFELAFLKKLDWKLSISRIFEGDLSYIIDFGPGKISLKLTQGFVTDNQTSVLSAVSKSDRKILSSRPVTVHSLP